MESDGIRIVLPVALKEAFEDLAPTFTAATGHTFTVALMLNPEVPGHIAGGADWSIALSNPQYIEEIIARADCEGGLHRLGYSPLAIAVRGPSDGLQLTRPDEIAAFLWQVESIAITEGGTSGAQFARLTEALGMTGDIEDRLRLLPGGGPMAALLGGDVAAAALPLSNVATVPQVHAKAICPRDMGVHIELAFCLHAQANAATRAFAEWLLGSEVQNRLRALGVVAVSDAG